VLRVFSPKTFALSRGRGQLSKLTHSLILRSRATPGVSKDAPLAQGVMHLSYLSPIEFPPPRP
jgi:hypothetical protein